MASRKLDDIREMKFACCRMVFAWLMVAFAYLKLHGNCIFIVLGFCIGAIKNIMSDRVPSSVCWLQLLLSIVKPIRIMLGEKGQFPCRIVLYLPSTV